MASGSQNMTTFNAKHLIGDSSNATATNALLQTGAGVTVDTWILHRTNRATNYGLLYNYDYVNGVEGDADKIEFIGKNSVAAYIRLDTGVIHLNSASSDQSTSPAFEIMEATKLFQIIPSNRGEGIDMGYNWNNYDGAGISLRTSSSSSYPGQFTIWARRDSSHSHTLTGQSGGQLTWTGYFTANQNITIRRNNKDKVLAFEQYDTGATVGFMKYDSGDATDVTGGQFSFAEYSPNSTADGNTTGYAEVYYLPSCVAGLTADISYDILTTKDLSFSITGNAATATKATQDGDGNVITSKYVTVDTDQTITGTKSFGVSGAGCQINGAGTNGGINSIRIGDDVWLGDCNAGGIMGMKSTGANTGFYFYNSSGTNTGQLYADGTYMVVNKGIRLTTNAGIYYTGSKATYQMIRFIDNTGDVYGNGVVIGGGGQSIIGGGESASVAAGQAGTGGSEIMWICNDGAIEFYPNLQNGWTTSYKNYIGTNGHFYSVAVHNAIWNDLAEQRKSYVREPGYAIIPSGYRTSKRLEPGARIISDTYGMCMGEVEGNSDMAPVGLAGRVLAYPLHDKSYYKVGDVVCAAEGGKIDKMTREEIREYPDRIIGIVNEIPDYDIWEPSREGGGREPIHTNGRIWIDVR